MAWNRRWTGWGFGRVCRLEISYPPSISVCGEQGCVLFVEWRIRTPQNQSGVGAFGNQHCCGTCWNLGGRLFWGAWYERSPFLSQPLCHSALPELLVPPTPHTHTLCGTHRPGEQMLSPLAISIRGGGQGCSPLEGGCGFLRLCPLCMPLTRGAEELRPHISLKLLDLHGATLPSPGLPGTLWVGTLGPISMG